MPRKRIGLLGGSFNPAHDGHRHISLIALRQLKLHEVWWMVSPQNPLKGRGDMAPFEERCAGARRVARHQRIRVTDIEQRLGTVYTVDTLRLLLPRFPNCRFVWLMGADNLHQIAEWKGWHRIFMSVPIAVFARPPYSLMSLVAKPVHSFRHARVRAIEAASVVDRHPPAWVFLHIRPHAGSATRIRAGRAGGNGQAAAHSAERRDAHSDRRREPYVMTS